MSAKGIKKREIFRAYFVRKVARSGWRGGWVGERVRSKGGRGEGRGRQPPLCLEPRAVHCPSLKGVRRLPSPPPPRLSARARYRANPPASFFNTALLASSLALVLYSRPPSPLNIDMLLNSSYFLPSQDEFVSFLALSREWSILPPNKQPFLSPITRLIE